MLKAPRYMREYASHIIKSAKQRKIDLGHVNDEVWNETIVMADRIVRNYIRGLITESEAMIELARLPY